MKFSAVPVAVACSEVAAAIHTLLQDNERIVWFVSGGSCIGAEVEIATMLPTEFLPRITVLLADERYGAEAHPDSNYRQLKDAGFMREQLEFTDVLAEGLPFAETCQQYNTRVTSALQQSGAIIATLGIGTDGHTAGILPDSPATQKAAANIIGYPAGQLNRMTVGIEVLRRVTNAFVFAYGEAKQVTLERVRANTADVAQLPALVLYDIPSVTIYNDTIETKGVR